MKMTYQETAQMMQEWEPKRPETGQRKMIALIAGFLMGLLVLGVSAPSDWPGSFVIAILGGWGTAGIIWSW